MRVHFLYQIFSLIKLFDIWERLQGTLFLQFVRSHSVFQEIFSFYFLKLVIFPYFWHNRYMKLTIQRMARIAILSALAVGLRSAFIGLPNIQPITAMFFVAVLYLGLLDGLLIMALTMLISGFIFGFGPWVFNQILAFGILMALWSLIAPRLSLVWQIALVTTLSFLYGVLLDYSYGLLFKSGLTFVVSGLLYDTYHAVSTLLFYPFIQSVFRRFLK